MSDELLLQQINALVNGTISEAEHQELQDRLKSDAVARTLFRERMDLEAGLRTWAADSLINEQSGESRGLGTQRPKQLWSRWNVTLLATAASIVVIAFWWTQSPGPEPREVAERQRQTGPKETTQTTRPLGKLVQQIDCIWEQSPSLEEDRFSTGSIKLTSGAAELRFDSGTNVILEGPCEMMVETVDSAQLLAGTVFVNVTEVSNGFLLETPDAQIIDEGTQYAVSLDSQATEVYVFDGSVIWALSSSTNDFEDRITTGEARRYLRSDPGRSHHIPFGKRQFVRQIEEAVREAGGGELLAYDGFENLAGQLRRGRSGFGWAVGWESAGRGRGSLADVIDAPDDVVFGLDRSGRRLLSLRGGDNLRRAFENPIVIEPGNNVFVSLLVSRQVSDGQEGSSLQILLEPDSSSPRYTRRHSVAFGMTSGGLPFVNNAGTVDTTAVSLSVGEPYLFVFKYEAKQSTSEASLRVFGRQDSVENDQVSMWTVQGTTSSGPTAFTSIRFSLGAESAVHIDELRIGDSWSSVINSPSNAMPKTNEY